MTTPLDRIRGSILGLAVGDALGAAVEFKPPGTFPPVTGYRAGGPFNLAPGEWTDDTSMAICLAESLIACQECDPADQLARYVRWYRQGENSVTGRCFDIGGTTRSAIQQFERTGMTVASADPYAAGNGSLMRLAPAPLARWRQPTVAIDWAAISSRTTHAAPAAVASCQVFAALLVRAVASEARDQLLDPMPLRALAHHPEVRAVVEGSYRAGPPQVSGSGYVVRSLEAALWAFATTDSFSDAVLAAVNLGDDADTVGAIAGQIAGAFYGIDAIPAEWLAGLAWRDTLDDRAQAIGALADS